MHASASLVLPAGGRASHAAMLGGWRLVRQLACGEQAELWQAAAAGQDAAAACYVLKRPRHEGDWSRALLAREAAVAAVVSHPRLTTVLADGSATDQPHLVLPYYAGATLAELGAVAGRLLPPGHWVPLLREAAAALAALHAAGWVHGDVKPAHLLVSRERRLTLLDLGLARRFDSPEGETGDCLTGAPAYLAPELLQAGGRYSPASDYYALARAFLPLACPDPKAALHERVLGGRVVGTAGVRWRSDLPGPLARLLGRMLAQEPLRRPSGEEIADTLLRCELDLLGQ